MEKRLGENESFNIKFNSLVAFDNTIKFKKANKVDFIELNGPGLVIFELGNKDIESIREPTSYNINIVYLISIILFLLFVNVLFDNILEVELNMIN